MYKNIILHHLLVNHLSFGGEGLKTGLLCITALPVVELIVDQAGFELTEIPLLLCMCLLSTEIKGLFPIFLLFLDLVFYFNFFLNVFWGAGLFDLTFSLTR